MALNARPQRANGARSSGPAASRPSVRRVSVQARSLSDTGKEAMLGGREWLSTILSRFGPATDRAGLVSFLLGDVHAHDVVTVADQRGVALRGGHHCNQPLMKRLGVASTARASFYFYNTRAEVDRFIEVVREIQQFFAV